VLRIVSAAFAASSSAPLLSLTPEA
jgi:hypothetical protein